MAVDNWFWVFREMAKVTFVCAIIVTVASKLIPNSNATCEHSITKKQKQQQQKPK